VAVAVAVAVSPSKAALLIKQQNVPMAR
jgi:hypothetical protein